jgi:MFS family permease
MMATAIVLGAGMGLSHPVLLALLYRSAPPGRQGEAMGVRSTMIYASQIGTPLLLGSLGAGLGLAGALWPFAVVLLAGCRYALTHANTRA